MRPLSIKILVPLYGFMGCGQIELARALFGKLSCDRGSLKVDGKPFRLKNTAHAAEAGRVDDVERQTKGRCLQIGQRRHNQRILFATRQRDHLLRRVAGGRPRAHVVGNVVNGLRNGVA